MNEKTKSLPGHLKPVRKIEVTKVTYGLFSCATVGKRGVVWINVPKAEGSSSPYCEICYSTRKGEFWVTVHNIKKITRMLTVYDAGTGGKK